MFFQSKIRTEAIEANRQFGQIVYGKSGRIGDLASCMLQNYSISDFMHVTRDPYLVLHVSTSAFEFAHNTFAHARNSYVGGRNFYVEDL